MLAELRKIEKEEKERGSFCSVFGTPRWPSRAEPWRVPGSVAWVVGKTSEEGDRLVGLFQLAVLTGDKLRYFDI